MTDWPDIVNGTLEAAGGFFILLSILRLHKDKVVRGVSWIHVAFFSTWGYWNLFYYWQLDQWWSWYGGIGVVTMNTLWLFQIVWWSWVERCNRRDPRHLSCGPYDDTH